MVKSSTGMGAGAFNRLRQMAQAQVDVEVCELCGVALAADHRHLLEVANHRIICACDACALRFESVIDGRFKLIPRDTRTLNGFQMSDEQWEALALPINLVFLFNSTPHQRVVALYPSPAGVTESLLTLENWTALVDENPALAQMQPDVEALLINRVRSAREYFLAPMDVCYQLAGLIRVHWRGLSGGEQVWQEIDSYFNRLKRTAIRVNGANHA